MTTVSGIPSYDELAAAWRALRVRGVRVREVACVGSPRTLLFAEYGDPRGLPVQLSAGVHGDEPAAPWALHALVRDGLLDPRLSYRIWPCLNPTGYVARRRENAEGQDINRSFSRGGLTPEARAVLTANRDRRYLLAIDMHEDFEAEGAYVFEPLPDALAPSAYALRIVAALDEAGLPVQMLHDGFELGTPPGDGPLYRLERGAVLVDAPAETRAFHGSMPSSLALLYRGTSAVLTLESPSLRPWGVRLATHRVAVTTALRLAREYAERT
ncbi:MAG TPA: succinylglutamate desuccinylase/aspartoacylase family protein [Candidatus Limnocylindria bacterium]|nr:succinylglutamate desuccinylase/aspartoacylase family protein [Candidatus Limnocylindria bacterium]